MTSLTRPTPPVPMPALGAGASRASATRGAVFPHVSAGITTSIGILILVGWTMRVPEMRALGPATNASTNPTAALCFVGLGAALWLMATSIERSRGWLVARALAAAVIVAGGVRLFGAVVGQAGGIDTVLFHDAMAATGDGRSNRMAVAAAVNFTLLGTSILLLAHRVQAREALAQVLAIVVLALSQVALLAHAYRSGWFETIGHFNRMAVPTSVAFSLMALGVLSLRRESGVLAVVLSDGPGGTMARGLLPAGFLAPAVFGWIAIWGLRSSSRAEQPDLVIMLFVVAMILVFVGLIAWNATQVHHTHVDRTRAEAALRDSEVRFRLLAENGSDVVSLHDPSGRVAYISPSCERVLGFTPDEVMRMSPFAMVHPDDGDRLRRHFDDLLRGAPVTAISCRMLHKTGKHLWLEMMWRSVADGEGRVVRLQASSRDVTERKDYERQLEDARRKLQTHQESLLEANARLAALASHDGLTGLKNRRAFEERLVEELARIRRSGQPVSLLLLDIDHFKAFNDSFGHPRGDEVLRSVARLLSRAIRDTDIAVRYGGEEFAIVLPNTDPEGAALMGERLRLAIEEAPWAERAITISVGAATATSHTTVVTELLEHADRALYRSKQGGRNRVTLAEAA
ncbi:MAG: diguanylate cyclase [Gemmatimonadetes bacterium]|nr:diguanylate cyclase [Gemmatimonadota bacterium]